MFLGVLAEISMKAKILRETLSGDPNSVEEVLAKIEGLEDELIEAFGLFCGPEPK